ncbi:uncharacterized protein RJT21DRAFT_116523 [Scheffersomyces amazonensis]|uniref:uncharacterized protein n=1 Tax=Scheffersomyces amazonensis TaxID=1078765 RepID=UPI00315DD505
MSSVNSASSSKKSSFTHINHDTSSLTVQNPSPVSTIDEEDEVEDAPADLENQPLLQHGIHHYLDPDDPQVSPLNLSNIKRVRLVISILVWINAIAAILFIISDFISIPGVTNYGKSFFELDLILWCLLSNWLCLSWFAVPVYTERILGYITCGLLGVDFLVVVIITSLRKSYGWIGLGVLVWTSLTALLDSIVNYWVEQGKEYQEVRYTGRIEKRKTFTEMLIIFIKGIFRIILVVLIWNISLTLWLQAFDSHEKPWGKLIKVNDEQVEIHLACYGDVHNTKEQPIILVEGGQLTSSEVFQDWIEELYHLNKIDRYCVWDRPGYAFSSSSPSPVSIGIISEYLSEALDKEGIEGPFTLVGFDIGGLYSRIFASRHLEKIHSILLVDSWHEDLLKKFPFSGINRKNESPQVFNGNLELMDNFTGFKLWIKGIISPLGIISNLHWLLHPVKHSSKARVFGSDMIYQSKYIRARLQEQLTSGILSYNELKSSEGQLKNVPMSIVSSDYMIKTSLNWGKWQREISTISTKTLEWVIAENSGHLVWESSRGRDQLQQVLLRLLN